MSTSRKKPIKISENENPLHLAAEEGNLAEVQRLIAEGEYDINVLRWQTGETPLSYAVRGGHKQIVDELLEHGAIISENADNAEFVSFEMVNPLSVAAASGSLEMVKELIEKGAPIEGGRQRVPTVIFIHSGTPLAEAAANGHDEIVAFLIEQCRTKVDGLFDIAHQETDNRHNKARGNGNYCLTPIEEAAASGHIAIVKYLLEHGAKMTGNYGALHIAIENQHDDIAELLIAHGADVNNHTPLRATPLFCAVLRGTQRSVDMLYAAGADPDAKTMFEKSTRELLSEYGIDLTLPPKKTILSSVSRVAGSFFSTVGSYTSGAMSYLPGHSSSTDAEQDGSSPRPGH